MGPGTQNMHIWPVLKDPDFSKNLDFLEGRGYKIDAPIYVLTSGTDLDRFEMKNCTIPQLCSNWVKKKVCPFFIF